MWLTSRRIRHGTGITLRGSAFSHQHRMSIQCPNLGGDGSGGATLRRVFFPTPTHTEKDENHALRH